MRDGEYDCENESEKADPFGTDVLMSVVSLLGFPGSGESSQCALVDFTCVDVDLRDGNKCKAERGHPVITQAFEVVAPSLSDCNRFATD